MQLQHSSWRCRPNTARTTSNSRLPAPYPGFPTSTAHPHSSTPGRRPHHTAINTAINTASPASPLASPTPPNHSEPGTAQQAQQAEHSTARPSFQDKAVGCLLAAACGDVLGHPFEGLGPSMIQAKRPEGVQDFYISESWDLSGRYSGDTQMLIGLASSLAARGVCDPEDVVQRYTGGFDLGRGYREFDSKILEALRDGEDWRETGRKYLLGGWSLSAAARISPIGLAYSGSTNAVMLSAVKDAIVSTHTHAIGIEGAFVQALAVKLLAIADPDSSTPEAFLQQLLDRCREDDMKKRLRLLSIWVRHVAEERPEGPIEDWRAFLQSDKFEGIIKVRRMLAEELQFKSTQAVACALWPLCYFWDSPEDAVICSVHLGGYTHSVAAMTGAMVGARHGRDWIPSRWLDNLENGEGGKDNIIALGVQLAGLDMRS